MHISNSDQLSFSEIDHCFIRDNQIASWNLKTLNWSITDHKALFLYKKSSTMTKKAAFVAKKINFPLLDEMFLPQLYDNVYRAIERNEHVEIVTNQFVEITTNLILNATSTSIRKSVKTQPWINNRILKLIKTRDNWYSAIKHLPNNHTSRYFYKVFRNKVKKEIKNARKNYACTKLQNNSGNSREQHRFIRELLNFPEKKGMTVNADMFQEPDHRVLANKFNVFFTNIGYEIANSVPKRVFFAHDYYVQDELNFCEISTNEIIV